MSWRNGGSRPLAAAWLQSSADGYCAETSTGSSDCTKDDKGAWPMPKRLTNALQAEQAPWVGAAQWCLARCARCQRCEFVSLSLKYRECDWFASCNTSGLVRIALHFEPSSFRTMPLRLATPQQLDGDESPWRGRGRSAFLIRAEDHDRLDSAAARVRKSSAADVTLPHPASAGVPLLLLGLISGSFARREVHRCTWMRILPRMGGGVRVRFVVGKAERDAAAADVLPVAVAEHVALHEIISIDGSVLGSGAAGAGVPAGTAAATHSPRSTRRPRGIPAASAAGEEGAQRGRLVVAVRQGGQLPTLGGGAARAHGCQCAARAFPHARPHAQPTTEAPPPSCAQPTAAHRSPPRPSHSPQRNCHTWPASRAAEATGRPHLTPCGVCAEGDDDIFVQPRMAYAHAALLLRCISAAPAGQVCHPGAHVFAGVFEYYSWRPGTLESSGWCGGGPVCPPRLISPDLR